MSAQDGAVLRDRARRAQELLDVVAVASWALAAAALAASVLERHPRAIQAQLRPGEISLQCVGWVDDDARVHDIAGDLPGGDRLPLGVRSLGVVDHRTGRLRLADALVIERAQVPLVEVLAVRDPDGPVEVTAAVLGCLIPDVTEHHVDAGAGWTLQAWRERAAACAEGASPAMRPYVEGAFADPPGAGYVVGVDDQQGSSVLGG